jgi:hypothetical protein
MNGPSFWRSCNSSARYWLRHRNPIQPRDTREIEAEIRRRPRGQERERSNLLFLPRNPPNLSTETYLPTSGGPGGLTCGDMARPGAKQASVPCRPSMAAGSDGAAAGCQSGEARTGGGGEDDGVCVFIALYRSLFLGAVAVPLFWKISAKPCPALRCARHLLASQHLRHPARLPRRVFINPCRPWVTAGIRINQLCHILPLQCF